MLNFNQKYFFLIFPFFLISQGLTIFIIGLISLITFIKIILTKNYSVFNNKIVIYLLLFNIYIIISSINSNNIILSLESSLFYFRFTIFAIFISFILESKKKYLSFFLNSLIILTLFISIDGFFQYFSDYNLIGLKRDEVHTGRLSGIFNKELILGSFISRIFPIILGLSFFLKKEKKFIYSKLGVFLYLSFLLGILVSGDRTALIYFLDTTLFMIIFLKNFRKLFILIALLASLLILIVTSINPTFKKRFIDRTLNEDLNISQGIININFFTSTHEEHYKTAILVFKESPLMGVGPKLFREECKKFENIYLYGCSTHPHNNFLQILSEIGIIGLLFYLLAIGYFITHLINNIIINRKKNDPHNEIIVKNFMIIAILISLQPLFPSSNFFGSYINTFYYAPLGIYLALNNTK